MTVLTFDAIDSLSDSYLDVISNIEAIRDLDPEYVNTELDSLHIEQEQVMSNLRAKQSSSSAEELDNKSVGHSNQGFRSSSVDRPKLAALKARRQVKVDFSERIVKLQQELAELRIQKAALDAIDKVDQDVCYNQVESKAIIS